MFFEDIYHSFSKFVRDACEVVICFRFVLWRYLPQFKRNWYRCFTSCDLLSIYSLKIFTTVKVLIDTVNPMLWFAFDLFFEDIYHSMSNAARLQWVVVICFRFVLWRYLPQYEQTGTQTILSCDLLSICSLKIFTTVTA